MHNPLISVIVPIYKVESYISQCVDSLLNQTFDRLEIILVDDGSPDRSPAICDEYASRHKNIRVIHKPNGGVVSARKAGIKEATGDYICYVDGDDWVLSDYFEHIANMIHQNHADVIVHGYTIAGETSTQKHLEAVPCGFYDKEGIGEKIIPTMLSRPPFFSYGIMPSIWSKAIKRELLLPIQMAAPDAVIMGEDTHVSYPAILQADTLEVSDECGYMYRTNEGSITRKYDKRFIHSFLVSCQYLKAIFENDSHHQNVMPQFHDYVCYMTYGTISNEIIHSSSTEEAVKSLESVISEPIVREAVLRKDTPLKVKAAFQAVDKQNRLLYTAFRKYWLRGN